MLLVTGATGTTGMEVLRALKDRGVAARALVRDETKAHHLRDLGFEPATGDLGDPRTLGPALDGVERAYLVSPAGPSVRGSPRSPVTGSKPRSRRWCAWVSSRTSARAGTSRSLSARRTSLPVVPVAPVTSSIYRPSSRLNSSLSSAR